VPVMLPAWPSRRQHSRIAPAFLTSLGGRVFVGVLSADPKFPIPR